MLLIHCPYCDEDRPELEFRNAGEAHIARPADPSVVMTQTLLGSRAIASRNIWESHILSSSHLPSDHRFESR